MHRLNPDDEIFYFYVRIATLTARSIIIGELRFFFARRGLNGCLGRLGHACRVLLGRGNHLHNPDLVGTKGINVL